MVDKIKNIIEQKIKINKDIFYNDDSAYGIYSCEIVKESSDFLDTEIITIVGNMPRLILGKEYTTKLEKVYNKKFGEQYKIINLHSDKKSTQEEEQECLKFFVTDLQFKNIVKVYSLPITAITTGEFDYKKVKGIGEKSFESIKKKVIENAEMMSALSTLGCYGIKYNHIKKMVNLYGSAELTVQKIFDNPYVLYKELSGVGFKTCDQIAQAIGFDFNSPKRIMAGIMYSVEQEESKGNTWGIISAIKENAEEVLGLQIENIDEFLDSPDFYVDKENDKIALKKTWQCEMDITEELYRLNNVDTAPLFSDEEVEKYIGEIEQELNIQYTDEQKQLFYEVNKNNLITLTGWAGTGKTFTLNGCLKMIEKKLNNIILASPTAKASKVLEKSTGRISSTIHRKLEWFQGEFMRNEQNPLDANVIVIDEISMCDIWLFRSLLRAIPLGCKLILVGDPAQLESVATGNVLHDIINSECFPVVKLQTVFRQALESGILSAATDVRQGIKFYDSKSESLELGIKKDCRLWFGEKTDTAKRIAMIYKACLKKWSVDDILTIVPMKKSESGVNNLNSILQEIANSQDGTKNQLDFSFRILREGDRVIHIKNDYNAEWLDESLQPTGGVSVFNGDTGIIKKIITNDRLVYVNYGDKIIEYHSGNFDQLQLAYCITCHKSQGSQSPVVIMGIDISAYMNLKRSLVYTSITRASQQLFIIAECKALSMAIYNDALVQKKTFLKNLLINYKKDFINA